MKLGQLYRKAIEIGLSNDPRTEEEIDFYLEGWRKKYQGLSDKEKEFFDKQLLEHPFADSRILNGEEELEIKTIFVGIDIDTAEVLLVDRLREKGTFIDAIVSHHPSARAWAQFYEVMDMQADILSHFGLNPVVAEKLLYERKSEVGRKVMSANHHKALSSAKHLGIAWMCIHTPADNCVTKFLKGLFEQKSPKTLGDVLDVLYDIPEYQEGARRGIAPVILLGSKRSKAGKIVVDMTGGTEGPKENFEYLAREGVGTIVGMHFSEEHYRKAKDARINLVIAGHMSSDTLGMNLLLDEVEKSLGELNVIEGAGFYRIRHGE